MLKTKGNHTKQNAIVFDLDGTVFEQFFICDKEYIMKIYDNNKFVNLIDDCCRKINNTDLIKNTNRILNLRLAVYSIFVKKAFSQIMDEYKKLYLIDATLAIECAFSTMLQDLAEKKGYHVIILSNNMYAKDLQNLPYHIVATRSKLDELRKLSHIYDVCYFVGNNYMDDIYNAHILGIPPVYVGKSSLVKNSRKLVMSKPTLEQCVEEILKIKP